MPFVDLQDFAIFDPKKYRKHNFFDSPQLVADVYALEPGQAQAIHAHDGEAKVYGVLEGYGEFTIGEETRTLGPRTAACAPAGVPHGVVNRSAERLLLLVVIAPNPNIRTH